MLNFVFILLIIFEIPLVVFCCKKLMQIEKRVIELNEKTVKISKIIIVANQKVKEVIKNINKVISILTNKKLLSAIRIIKIAANAIQVILLIRSLKLASGIKKIDFKVVRTLFYAQAFKQLLGYAVRFICSV